MSQGWISVHRKIQNHWLWDDKPFSKGQAWIDILMLVNHEDGKSYFRDSIYEIKRGQRITSELQLAERWGWSRNKVRKFLNDLEKEQMLKVEKDNRKTILEVVNYNIYQGNKTTEGTTESITDETSESQQKDTNNNDNNDNKNNNKDIYSQNKIPYEKIVELYNNICKTLPKIQKLTDKRKRTIKARWKKYNDLSIYVEVFKKAEESEFLSGRSGKWTGCNFDWLINENNMVKVLEGNYDNQKKGVNKNEELDTRVHNKFNGGEGIYNYEKFFD